MEAHTTRPLPGLAAQDGSVREDAGVTTASSSALPFSLTLALGIALMVVSYLYMAAPLGLPTSESFSNPRLPFAAGIFVLGVVVSFLSAAVYVLSAKER